MTKKFKVYIAGPYSKGDVAENVHKALETWHTLKDLGFSPYCPHLTHFLHLHKPRPYTEWLEYDKDWLPSCDAILRIAGDSTGADSECQLAKECQIPVFTSIEDLLKALEIEQKFLLTGIPPSVEYIAKERLIIEQGYLPNKDRLRKTINLHGKTTLIHCIKSGKGLVKFETEKVLSPTEWANSWPLTEGARIYKTRYEIDDPNTKLVWEIDDFRGDLKGLVLAEVELPSPATQVIIPSWLANYISHNVTDSSDYSNFKLATKGKRKRCHTGEHWSDQCPGDHGK